METGFTYNTRLFLALIILGFFSTILFSSLFKTLFFSWLLVLSCLLPLMSWAQTPPTFDMAVQTLASAASLSGYPEPDDIIVDAAGNSYIRGSILGSARFGNQTVSATSNSCTYIAKIDAAGVYRWIVKLDTNVIIRGGGVDITTRGLALDAAGNIWVAGFFTSPTLRVGATILANAGGSDVFVGKLDANGNWLSATRVGGAGNEEVYGLTLDSSNNAYITGRFSGTLSFGSTTLTSTLMSDIFVARLDASGNWRWAVRGGGSGSDWGTDVGLDASGHIYVMGGLGDGGGLFGPFSVQGHSYIARLDATTGAYQRLTGVEPGVYGRMAVDAAGACYLAGSFTGSIAFGSFTVVNSSTGSRNADVFVAKLDAAGAWQWASTTNGASDEYCAGIALDDQGNAYITGSFRGLGVQFGNTTLIPQNATQSFLDVYVAKLNTAGYWQWAVSAGGQRTDVSTWVALGPGAAPHLVGYYMSSPMTFGSLVLPGGATTDTYCFLARLQPNQLRIAGDSVLCSGGSTQLTASTLGTGVSWRWSTGATGASINVSQPGTYTVTATFPNGYSLSETYRVRSIAPSVQVTGTAGFLCPGTPRQLTAVAAGATGWRWSTGATTPGITVTQPGTYTVAATFSSACTATAQAVVVGNEVRISGRLQLCPGQSTTLTATATGAAVTGYRWNTGATTPTLLVGQAGTYQVTATFADGCQLSTTHTVGPPVADVASVSGDTILCRGRTLTLTALNPDAITYRWSTGATTPSIAITQPGTYGVVLSYTGGCTSRDSLRVPPAVVLPAALTLGRDTTVCEEEPLLLRVPIAASPGVLWRWSDGSSGPTLTVREAGVYSLTISTPCERIVLRRSVSYTSCLLIPNVITPNGDQRNDRFFVRNMTGGDWGLTLFDRWGRQVYHTNAYRQEWGQDAPAGIYYYILRRPIVNVLYKGWLEVIR